MRKMLVVAVREYQAAVRTKAFIISIVAMPVMMMGSIVIQGIPHLLYFFKQPLKNSGFNCSRIYKVKHKAVFLLSVPVDNYLSMFNLMWIPWNVLIEHDMTAMEIYSLAGCLGSSQNLDFA